MYSVSMYPGIAVLELDIVTTVVMRQPDRLITLIIIVHDCIMLLKLTYT